MNNVFRDCLDKFFEIFIDDILICSKNEEEHEEHIILVFQTLREDTMQRVVSVSSINPKSNI